VILENLHMNEKGCGAQEQLEKERGGGPEPWDKSRVEKYDAGEGWGGKKTVPTIGEGGGGGGIIPLEEFPASWGGLPGAGKEAPVVGRVSKEISSARKRG